MFSRIDEAQRRSNAVTLDQLRNVIPNSYTPSPSTVYRENIFDKVVATTIHCYAETS